MAEFHSDPKSSSSLLHPLLLTPHGNEVLDNLEREQRDRMVATIGTRMVTSAASQPLASRRHTKTTLRRLAWPVWVNGIQATCVITVYYIAKPRSHETERLWFASMKEAKEAFPRAQLLDDAACVPPRLRAARA
ncbi:MAG: hypothetical protein LAO24_05690 [Acidobacteriia bacterium]|nr:hypothetical protein [Terriglobia bacterium]